METETQQQPTEIAVAALDAAGVTVEYTFIPFDQSRNCKDPAASWWKEPNWPSLNWRVVVKVHGKPVLITDYSAGIGHIPGYRPTYGKGMTVYDASVLAETIKTGYVPLHRKPHVAKPGRVPAPSREDAMYSLLSDGTPDFDALTFADWCADYGYDTDSREAEKTYNQCREHGAALRGAIGATGIETLREVFQDY